MRLSDTRASYVNLETGEASARQISRSIRPLERILSTGKIVIMSDAAMQLFAQVADVSYQGRHVWYLLVVSETGFAWPPAKNST